MMSTPIQDPAAPVEGAPAAPEPAPMIVSLSSQGFPHRPPFPEAFHERVPLVQAFHMALTQYEVGLGGRGLLGKMADWRRGGTAPPFLAAECGVYTGSSVVACASIARDRGIEARFVGLDTFSGLPPLSETDVSLAPKKIRYLRMQLFADTSVEQVRARIAKAGFARNIELLQGLFADTLPTLPKQRYHFVNVDCDLYEPHLECLEYFYPRMVRGGVLFFDDYHSANFPMARQAIDVFMKDKPEVLYHLRYGADLPNHTKSFIVKS